MELQIYDVIQKKRKKQREKKVTEIMKETIGTKLIKKKKKGVGGIKLLLLTG